jgi:tetratricopeptide (TPR) repeat protein
VVVILTLLGIVADVLGIVGFFGDRPASPSPPVAMSPTAMAGDLNIAVAEFSAFDDRGGAGQTQSAAGLARSVFQSLESRSQQVARTDFLVELRAPKDTGPVSGRDPAERKRRLEDLAETINADVIVAARLVSTQGETTVTPELYMRGRKLRGALELEGYHEFGMTKVAGGLDANMVTRRDWRDRLRQQVDGAAQLIVALSYYYGRQFSRAFREFDQALGSIKDAATRNLIYLFLGNASIRKQDLPDAGRYYRRALETDPKYGRAQLGLAELEFQRTRGSCEPGEVDADGLRSTLKRYQSALHAGAVAADLQTKVAFGLGRVYVCLSQAEIIDGWAEARGQLTKVVEEYRRGKHHLQELASESYASLGFINLPPDRASNANTRLRQSADAYRKAIELSLDERRMGVFYGYLGFILGRLDETQPACEAYERAAALDPVRATRYRRQRAGLRGCA